MLLMFSKDMGKTAIDVALVLKLWTYLVYLISPIRTEYREIRSISPSSNRMRKNTDHNNPEYGHFWRSVDYLFIFYLLFIY